MRSLTTNQQRTLIEVHNGRIKRTASGWLIGGSAADASTRRTLTSLYDRGLITADHGYPLEPGETITAELTPYGTDHYHRYTGKDA